MLLGRYKFDSTSIKFDVADFCMQPTEQTFGFHTNLDIYAPIFIVTKNQKEKCVSTWSLESFCLAFEQRESPN